MSLMILKDCQYNKHLNIQNLLLDTLNMQLVKKHPCDANFFPFCQQWKRLDIWASKNDFSLLLILFQNWYLRSDKALNETNLQVPLAFYLLLLLHVFLEYRVTCRKILLLFARYYDLCLFRAVSFTNLTLISDFRKCY